MVRALNKRITIAIFIILEIAIAFFMFANINDAKEQQINLSKKMIKQEAASHFDSIMMTRRWSARHGGVFVKQHDDIEPNPYLKDNHIYSDTGERYIKINPAWMTRQISDISNKESNYYYKITSLKPINPENTVDAFEKKALEFFERNNDIKDYYEFSENFDTFNYIGSLKVEKSCLQCHEKQGYKIDDIRGGIRVSIPMEKYKDDFKMLESKALTLKTLITLLGLLIGVVFILFIHMIYKRQRVIEDLSITDPLTGLYNRRYFNTICQTEGNKAKRNNIPMAFMLLDIDHFKNYNDTYGHLAGDEVLKQISNVLQNMTKRATDYAFRLGGEEFGLIYSIDDKTQALIHAQNIKSTIEDLKIEHKKNTASPYVTISAGVCMMFIDETNGCSIDITFKKADTLLYEAKAKGKNQVLID